MTLLSYLSHGWNWNPLVLLSLAAAAGLYAWQIGRAGRPAYFAAALLLVAIALLSPLNLLATGVLFSAHMAQHIVLLLLVPALVLLSLPSTAGSCVAALHQTSGPRALFATSCALLRPPKRFGAAAGWLLGVGSMWFWHVPQLCDAAAADAPVHALQTLSLLGMGAVFWWPIISPRHADRLPPGQGIIYLFTACLACTALGILLTLTTVEVCPIFRAPSTAPAMWTNLRQELTAHRDQQIGGLLMWLPMCLVYVAAIVLELARWLGDSAPTLHAAKEGNA